MYTNGKVSIKAFEKQQQDTGAKKVSYKPNQDSGKEEKNKQQR